MTLRKNTVELGTILEDRELTHGASTDEEYQEQQTKLLSIFQRELEDLLREKGGGQMQLRRIDEGWSEKQVTVFHIDHPLDHTRGTNFYSSVLGNWRGRHQLQLGHSKDTIFLYQVDVTGKFTRSRYTTAIFMILFFIGACLFLLYTVDQERRKLEGGRST